MKPKLLIGRRGELRLDFREHAQSCRDFVGWRSMFRKA